jgi:transcriptional regulator with XRE-family HTH domain
MSTTTFATRLRTLRHARKLSQRALAERCSLQTLSIWLYESGRHTPKLKTAVRLAAALNVSLDELAGVGEAAKERNEVAAEFGPTSRLL